MSVIKFSRSEKVTISDKFGANYEILCPVDVEINLKSECPFIFERAKPMSKLDDHVLSPKQLIPKLSEEENRKKEDLEKRIDEELNDNIHNKINRRENFDKLPRIRARKLEKAKKRIRPAKPRYHSTGALKYNSLTKRRRVEIVADKHESGHSILVIFRNLHHKTLESDVKNLCGEYCKVLNCKIIETRKGMCAFVRVNSIFQANRMVYELDGTLLNGKILRAEIANKI